LPISTPTSGMGSLYGEMTHIAERYSNCKKKVFRFLCNVSKQTSCRDLFKGLEILPLPCIYIYEMVCWIKHGRGKLASNFDTHEHDTRHKGDLHLRSTRTNVAKLNGRNMGIILFNKLRTYVKKVERKHKFKSSVKQFL
jgi:hypothetical protein